MKRYVEKEYGITLIALIITIIVMLILVTVALSVIINNDGLFNKVNNAVDIYNDEREKEKGLLETLQNKIDIYIDYNNLKGDLTGPDNIIIKSSDIGETTFTLTATVKEEQGTKTYEFYVDDMDKPYKVITTEKNTVTCDVTEKLSSSEYRCKVIVYDRAGNSNESETILVETKDVTDPTISELIESDVQQTSFILTATGKDERKIAKYEFYVDDMDKPYKTVTTNENSAICEVIERTENTSYNCKVIVYDEAGNSKESTIISVTTLLPDKVEPNIVAKVGDFVNYKVTVNDIVYDKWRILHFNTNGHMEIVCYNGPTYSLGAGDGNFAIEPEIVDKAKYDYASNILLLNSECNPYKNGTYGYSARHLGSNPTTPSSYETILESYVINYTSNYNSSTSKPKSNLEYLEQKHHSTDMTALNNFQDTNKLLGESIWLASRDVSAGSYYTYFYVRSTDKTGVDTKEAIYSFVIGGAESTNTFNKTLAPVVSLESDILISTTGTGNGKEGTPWELTK